MPPDARPTVFMHIPKTAGTSVMKALLDGHEGGTVQGFDRWLFGTFVDFGSIGPGLRRSIYAGPAEMPADAALVAGHFSASGLRAAYRAGRFMTLLREPVTRLLSHWLYWRRLSDDDLAAWGGWSDRVKRARLPLASFLSDPDLACHTDNLTVRALLWPHRLIPNDGFIDPADDRRLLRQARTELRRFDFVDIVENPHLQRRIAQWTRRPITLTRENETASMPPERRSPLAAEIGPEVHHLLEAHSRLDLRLWSGVAGRRIATPPTILRNRVLMNGFARYGALMG